MSSAGLRLLSAYISPAVRISWSAIAVDCAQQDSVARRAPGTMIHPSG
jgi:hypothetical protein